MPAPLNVPTGLEMESKPHDPRHPYVLRFVGCGHGVLFKDYCRDCEIVGAQDAYRMAVKAVQWARHELRRLGVPVSGEIAP